MFPAGKLALSELVLAISGFPKLIPKNDRLISIEAVGHMRRCDLHRITELLH